MWAGFSWAKDETQWHGLLEVWYGYVGRFLLGKRRITRPWIVGSKAWDYGQIFIWAREEI